MDRIRCIAWDFDGVLNKNVVNGRFPWMDGLNDRFGVNGADFQRFIFGSGIFAGGFGPIMRGEEDILDRLQSWKAHIGFQGDVNEVLAFWFSEDATPCPDMMGLMDRVHKAGIRQVIATNNEHRRSNYIENEMGFSDRVETLFSSARMKVAKPDAGYFHHIEKALDLKPDEILLVDDFAENVSAATACGWQAHHFPENGHDALADRLAVFL